MYIVGVLMELKNAHLNQRSITVQTREEKRRKDMIQLAIICIILAKIIMKNLQRELITILQK